MRIYYYPHPILSHKSKPLIRVDQFIKDSIKEMLDYIGDNIVGLAANQIGLPYRFFVTCIDKCPVVINPIIYGHGGLGDNLEGCVSLPTFQLRVRRNNKIKLSGYDLEGNVIDLRLEGYEARICLHELDHINGVSIVDRAKNEINEVKRAQLDELIVNLTEQNFDQETWEKQIKILEESRCLTIGV